MLEPSEGDREVSGLKAFFIQFVAPAVVEIYSWDRPDLTEEDKEYILDMALHQSLYPPLQAALILMEDIEGFVPGEFDFESLQVDLIDYIGVGCDILRDKKDYLRFACVDVERLLVQAYYILMEDEDEPVAGPLRAVRSSEGFQFFRGEIEILPLTLDPHWDRYRS